MAPRSSAACTVLIALLSLGGGAAADAPEAAYDVERPLWRTLEFSASKLLMTARARVEAEVRPSAGIQGQLLGTPEGQPVPAGADVLVMTYKASGLGLDSLTTLIADPLSGGTLQREQIDQGSRLRQRTYRFTDIGAYHYTRRPASDGEESKPPELWSDRSEGMRRYPPSAVGRPVTEPTALLWIAAAGKLLAPGDAIDVYTFSRRHVHRVTVSVTGRRKLDVDYEERDAAGVVQRRRGRVEALALRVRGAPLDVPAGESEDFELLGLHGDLELALDPRTRVPLELRGRVKVAGTLTVRLRRALLR